MKKYLIIGLFSLLSGLNGKAYAWEQGHWSADQKASQVARLNSMQREVTQNAGTEPPFHNEYYDNHAEGIYVDVVSGEPLFSSVDKYDSGTGWPSFKKPIRESAIALKSDHELYEERTEVRSKLSDSHLGHVFPDGPAPTGKRYCMNSAALRFIPVADLEKSGYGEFLKLFPKYKRNPSSATEWQIQSSPEQTHLVELFSSEGCSSCPPADAWIASLRAQPGLWKTFVPIEFHVDYWNRLGWTDRFSKATFTARQREYTSQWGTESVYTPGFVLDGTEWRSQGLSPLSQAGQRVGVLSVKQLSSKKFSVSFSPESLKAKSYVITGALLGDGFETDVKSGENGGRTLKHEFVVLDLQNKSSASKSPNAEFEFTDHGTTQPKSFSVAFWVKEEGSFRPIQAAGGDLTESVK